MTVAAALRVIGENSAAALAGKRDRRHAAVDMAGVTRPGERLSTARLVENLKQRAFGLLLFIGQMWPKWLSSSS